MRNIDVSNLMPGVAALELGLLRVTGKDRVDLLHRLATNDLRPLSASGHWRLTTFATPHGKLVDWCTVVARPDELWVVTSPGRGATMRAWFDRYTILEDVVTTDLSPAWQALWVEGGGALMPEVGDDAVVEADAGVWYRALPSLGGAIVWFPRDVAASKLSGWVAQGLQSLTASALEQRRVLAGVPGPQTEFPEEVNPLELRLAASSVSFNKGCYVGQEVLSRLDSYDKLARLLMGFELAGVCAPVPELRLHRDGTLLGKITSLVEIAPGRMAGLAIVKREEAHPQSAMLVGPHGTLSANLVDRPFWQGLSERVR